MSPYEGSDPAPAEADTTLTVEDLGTRLADESLPLFDRYKAMFALRNMSCDEAAAKLGTVLVKDNSSALLRHEVAFVLGQIRIGSRSTIAC